MKRLIIIILILLIYQVGFSQTFGGGIFGGLSASQLEGDNWGGYNKAGLTFGIYTYTKLNKYVDAQLELKYVQKGRRSNSDDHPGRGIKQSRAGADRSPRKSLLLARFDL